MTKIFTSIGLMSGTSLDGVDASLIQSDGESKLNIMENLYIPYTKSLKFGIKELKRKINKAADLKIYQRDISSLEVEITKLQSQVVEEIIKKNKILKKNIDVIGFHGQTIYHSFENKISKQLGDGYLLSRLTNLPVVFDFRSKDIEGGGQGAPLSPIFHKLIYDLKNLNFPVVFVNIGGISNITFIDQNKIINSFDCGPGNCLTDELIQIKSDNNIDFDKNGEIAFKGSVNEIILENYLDDPFYDLKPPKTLDTNDFSISIIRGLSLENSITTLAELTSRTIIDSFNFFNKRPKKIILMGGGRKNNYFLKRIKELSQIETIKIDQLDFDGDFIESQAFAYFAIRNLLKKPITFKETTGVSKPCIGGKLIILK